MSHASEHRLVRDLRHALRSLLRSPGFTAAALIALAWATRVAPDSTKRCGRRSSCRTTSTRSGK